jgi:glycosyltransferase involved in cell wall biosynthesis
MRNESLDAARGDYAICWDADDYHGPTRLQAQVLACQEFPGKASFLQRALCYSFPTDTAFIRDYHACPIHGTICHPRNDAIRYPDLGKGEDTEFLKAWGREGYVAIQNDPVQYVRTHHQSNTWPTEHVLHGFTDAWALGQWHICDSHRKYLREVVLPFYHQIAEARNSPTSTITSMCPP